VIVERQEPQHITLTLTRRELTLINNALNETREALDEDELSIRVGAPLEELEQLLQQVHAALVAMRNSPS
jgi:hypothetical protein